MTKRQVPGFLTQYGSGRIFTCSVRRPHQLNRVAHRRQGADPSCLPYVVGGGSMIPMRLIALQVSRRPPGMCIYITRIIIGVHEFLFSKRFKALYSEYKSVPCLPARTRDRTLGSRNRPKAPASPCSGLPSPSFVATSSLRSLLTDFLCARPLRWNRLWIRSILTWKRGALRTRRCLLRHIPELESDYPAAVLHLGTRTSVSLRQPCW